MAQSQPGGLMFGFQARRLVTLRGRAEARRGLKAARAFVWWLRAGNTQVCINTESGRSRFGAERSIVARVLP